jgi:hypothetical protein
MPTFSFLYSIPYIILFLLLYVNVIPLYKFNSGFSANNYSIWLQQFFVIALLIIFLGFRGFLYTDWQSYYLAYDAAPSLFDSAGAITKFFERRWENGFLFYMILCKTISSNYFFFQSVSYIIDFILLFLFFKEAIPKQIIWGFLFFIIFLGIGIEFNLLRNSKSMMLFLISLKYIKEKKIVRYIMLNSFGVLFHSVSLLYLPLYFILDKKISRKFVLVLFIIGNFIYIFRIEWCKIFLSYISGLVSGTPGHLLKVYLSSKYFSSAYGISIGYLERLFTFILIFCLSKKLCKLNEKNLIYINAFYLYIFVYLYFSEMMIFIERVVLLFIFPYWVLYPQIYSFLTRRSKEMFLLILLFFGILKMYYNNKNILTMYDNVLLPYRSYHERLLILEQHGKNIYK